MPLIRLEKLANEPLEASVWIKDESSNPTGTHKDRKSSYLIQQALENNVDTLAIVTSGNAGYSLATLAKDTRVRIVSIVSNSIRPSIITALQSASSIVKTVDLSVELNSEQIIDIARRSEHEKIWDVTNTGYQAFGKIHDEIADQNPDVIICPFGSGELFLGLAESIEDVGANTSLIGVHPLKTRSMADKLCSEHLPLLPLFTAIQFRRLLSQKISHCLQEITEDEIRWCRQHAPDFLAAETSSLVPLYMIHRLRNSQNKIIMINTGKGICE